MIRKIMMALVAACMVLAFMPAVSAVPGLGQLLPGDGAEVHGGDTVYRIGGFIDAGGGDISLKDFIYRVNNGEISADADVTLINNITVPPEEGNDWEPLGADMEHAYNGTFDGNGKVISGIDIDRLTDSTYPDPWDGKAEVNNFTAFISFLGSEGVVKRLAVDGEIADVNYVAGIVSYNMGTIMDCDFNGTLKSETYPNSYHVDESINGGKIEDSSGAAGAIAAYSSGEIRTSNFNNFGAAGSNLSSKLERGGCNAGGIVGYMENGSVSDCRNYAEVSTHDPIFTVEGVYISAGGIVGAAERTGKSDSGPEIVKCENNGQVDSEQASGGILGLGYGVEVDSCTNKADVVNSKGSFTGGIAGVVMSNEYAEGVITGCYNRGSIIPAEQEECAMTGGIVGYASDYIGENGIELLVNLEDNRNYGDVTGGSMAGGIAGKLANSMDGEYCKAKNLINLGTVTGYEMVGGIAGSCPGVLRDTLNYGAVHAYTPVTKNEEEYDGITAGGIAGDCDSKGLVMNSVNVGSVTAEGDLDNACLGGIAGLAQAYENSYYCIDTVRQAASALGSDPESVDGALSLKEMSGTAAAEHMANLNEESEIGWIFKDDQMKGAVRYAMTPQLTKEEVELSDIIGIAGLDTSYKLKTDITSFTTVLPRNETYAYTGRGIVPDVEVTFRGQQLLPTDYDIYTCYNNVNVGEATVIIKGAGDYSGVSEGYFQIVPAKAKISKTTVGKKKITVKMAKSAKGYGASNFEIKYRVSGSSSWKTVKTSSQTKTIKNLKSKKKYQIQVRAYKTINGDKYEGEMSDIVTTSKTK